MNDFEDLLNIIQGNNAKKSNYEKCKDSINRLNNYLKTINK